MDDLLAKKKDIPHQTNGQFDTSITNFWTMNHARYHR